MEWGEPDTPNGIVRHYIISYNLSGSDDTNVTGTARTVTIGELLPFTFYEFTVVAFTIETGPGASDIVRTGEAGLCVYTIRYSFDLVTLYTKYYTHACLYTQLIMWQCIM